MPLDAVLRPDLIKSLVAKDPRVGQLFPDFKADEIAMKRMVNPRIPPLVGNDQAAHTPLDELFIDITQGRKRGDEFRM